MIDYFKGIYGTNLLLRVHGSALYKGMLVGCLSTLIYLAIELLWNKRSRCRLPNYWNRRSRWLVAFALLDSSQLLNDDNDDDDINNVNNGIEDAADDAALASLIPDLEDPYGAGVLVSGVTFLIIFRANTGYQRYWEAVSSLHQCMGKWMDATMCAASFHLQCVHYDGARPHNFYECDELNRLNLTLDRRRTSGAATTDFGGGGGCVGIASTATTTAMGMRRRSPRSAWKTNTTTTTTTTTRLTSAYDCEKEYSGDGNIFVGSKVVDNTTAATTSHDGGGDGGLSTSLSWRRAAMVSASTSSQPGSNDGGSRRGGGLQLQRSWRRSFNSSTMPLFGSSNSAPTPLILPNSVLDGEWNIIPPSPYTTSPDMFHRTELHSRYFPSSQYRHDANFAHRPPIIEPSLGEVHQRRRRQYDRSHGNGGGDYNNSTTTNPSKVSTATTTPPLFLQELAHLSSLACAVALSTLRNDMERGESPLGIYIPGSDWPEIDPDKLPKHVLHEFQPKYRIVALAMHWLGLDRLPRYRSKYNATRPLLILGGVSDAEITFLQRARGPHAKVELANSWLKEFIIRESLSGSFGNVNPSITSRVVQHLSDGMMGYHMARKIMYIPFPFPHAQLTTFYTVVMVFAIPFVMDQYVSVDGRSMLWVGCLLTFLTVTCLVGLHEVSRELENPFRNVPNDLPLCTLHAMYNEALVTMYSGFNPDSFWDPSLYRVALEALAAKRDYVRGNEHDHNLCGKSNGGERCSGGTFDANECRNGTTTTTPATVVTTSATSMKSSTDKDSLVVQSEKEMERGIATANGEPPLSSLTLADARVRMKKTVSFADESETIVSSDEVAVMELRNVLVQQSSMIKELGRLLDEDEDEN